MTCKTPLLILLCLGLALLVLALLARGTNPTDEAWRDFEGFWWGFMDIAFYGGECYIGLEIRLHRGGRPLVRYHRITVESEHWKASDTELTGDDLRIKGPDGREFHLTLDRGRRTMTGIYKGVDLDIPVFLRFSPEITAAAEDPAFLQNRKYSYSVPARLDDGLDCASLSEAGLAPEPVHRLMDALMADEFQNIRSLLVIKNGFLALEEYLWQRTEGGFPYRLDRDQEQNIYSATRSFTATLLGMAVDRGLINGASEKIAAFFPEHGDLFHSPDKDRMTIDHFLAMESGLRWGQAEKEAYQPHYDPIRSPAGLPIITFLLGQPSVTSPGSRYTYNNESSTVLGEIIRRSSGLQLSQFAQRHLFGPLGITEYHWFTYPDGVAAAGNGLRLTPRAMAKFGLLILNRGLWCGKRLVSEGWIEAALERQTAIGDSPYGRHWWLDTFVLDGTRLRAASARGHFGQFLFVVPSLRMTVVMTSASSETHRWDQPVDIMARYLLPAALAHESPSPEPEPPSIPWAPRSSEGIYRFREGRYGIIARRGKSLLYKPPDEPFQKMHPLEKNRHTTRGGDVLSFRPQEGGGPPILASIAGGVEELGLRLDEAPGRGGRKRIFVFPRTLLSLSRFGFAALLLIGAASAAAGRVRRFRLESASGGSTRVSRIPPFWAGVTALYGLLFTTLLLDSATELEEIINLGTYRFGWDEGAAALVSAITTLGLFFLTFRTCLEPKGNARRRIYFAALSLIALILSVALWSCGLFPLLLSG